MRFGLSPIPGFRGWLAKQVPAEKLAQWDKPLELAPKAPERQELLAWAARYLGKEMNDGKPIDPVARFHLGNGARVERLNWGADPSPKGLKQSFGLMVNYVYDLDDVERNHEEYVNRHRATCAAAIERKAREAAALLEAAPVSA